MTSYFRENSKRKRNNAWAVFLDRCSKKENHVCRLAAQTGFHFRGPSNSCRQFSLSLSLPLPLPLSVPLSFSLPLFLDISLCPPLCISLSFSRPLNSPVISVSRDSERERERERGKQGSVRTGEIIQNELSF